MIDVERSYEGPLDCQEVVLGKNLHSRPLDLKVAVIDQTKCSHYAPWLFQVFHRKIRLDRSSILAHA
jgi:hypothetical protein